MPASQTRRSRAQSSRRHRYYFVAAAACLAGIAGCAATSPEVNGPADGQEIVVVGRITAIDRTPMTYDADGMMTLQTQAHGAVTVHVPARANLCRAQGLDVFNTATIGMLIEAAGTATGPSDLTVCLEATHRLKVLQ